MLEDELFGEEAAVAGLQAVQEVYVSLCSKRDVAVLTGHQMLVDGAS